MQPLARIVTRRLLAALPLAWVVITAVFLIVQVLPGAALSELGRPGVDPRTLEHARSLLGADRTPWARYVDWVGGAVRGDLGLSYRFRQPVAELLASRIASTLVLAGAAIALQFVLGTAAGLVAARWRGGWLDRGTGAAAAVLCAVPSYAVGVALVGLLAVRAGWFPASQMHSLDAAAMPPAARLADALRHLALPCLALALPGAGVVAQYVREQLGRAATQRFMLAARARGAGGWRALATHGLRPALVPAVQLFGLALPALVGGNVVVEVLFAWPGMGRLAWEAVVARDEPLVLGCTLIGSLAVAAGTLAADLAATALDPRAGAAAP